MLRTYLAVAGSLLVVLSLRVVASDDASPPPANTLGVTVGESLPAFECTDDSGKTWRSADHVARKVVVLYFYPGDFTGGCTRQAQAYRDALAKIEELDAEVVGVSGDEVATHELFKQTYGLTHCLLADTDGQLAKLLGVPVKAGGRVRATGPDRKPLLNADGQRIDLERPVTLARWTVVVDREGKIVSLRSIVNPVTDAGDVRKIVEALAK